MFSFTRPSPAMKCMPSISSSYVPAGWLAKSVDAVVSASGRGATGGVAGLWSVSCRVGSALCAMSVRNGVSKCSVSAGTATGFARSPSTRPDLVTYCGQAAGRAGDELPVRVGEDHRHVEHVGVGELEAEQVGRPAPWSRPRWAARRRRRSSIRPVLTGWPVPSSAYSRRKTWWDACDV